MLSMVFTLNHFVQRQMIKLCESRFRRLISLVHLNKRFVSRSSIVTNGTELMRQSLVAVQSNSSFVVASRLGTATRVNGRSRLMTNFLAVGEHSVPSKSILALIPNIWLLHCVARLPIVTGENMTLTRTCVTRFEPIRVAQSRCPVPYAILGSSLWLHRMLALVIKHFSRPSMMSTDDVTLALSRARPRIAIIVQALFKVGLGEDGLVIGAHGYGTWLRVKLFSDWIELRVDRAPEWLFQRPEWHIKCLVQRAFSIGFAISISLHHSWRLLCSLRLILMHMGRRVVDGCGLADIFHTLLSYLAAHFWGVRLLRWIWAQTILHGSLVSWQLQLTSWQMKLRTSFSALHLKHT